MSNYEDTGFDRVETQELSVVGDATVGGDLTVTGALNVSGTVDLTAGTLAAAGSNQGNAAAISDKFTVVTGADGTKGVRLPSVSDNDSYLVLNNDPSNVLKVYPGTSDQINAESANVAVSIGPGQAAWFIGTSASQWYAAAAALVTATPAELNTLDVTAGTVAASKAVVVDANKDIGTFRALTLERLFYTPVARTASADGTGTGTIADAGMLQFVTVTSGDANHIVVLPTPTPGTIVVVTVAGTGFELRSSDPATIGINGGTGAGAESAIPANTTALLICESATSWKGLQLGSDGTLAKVEVAA